jgi:ATP-dependent helicase Lhr and Lhr-like helicase
VRRWIWSQGWAELRAFQADAIDAVLRGGDVLISAPTAGGKTEAAFLPLASRVADLEVRPGFNLLYISPLKALINDQFRRLEPLFEALDLPVHRWHGDVSAHSKAKARKAPRGVVLITPESLEALFMRRGREVPALFGNLDAVVVDELHAFIGSERGMQLTSLLSRLETAIGRRIDRIGLSATLGDVSLAAEALRLGDSDRVARISGKGDAALRGQIRGYWREPVAPPSNGDPPDPYWKRAIADHLFDTLRLGKNLVFATSRDNVEEMTDLLRERTEHEKLPEAFYAHHGNLSREHREFVEARLKDELRPATAVCTSTLELGIDIGAIDAVAQIGPPFTVSSLRQRLGRSGRRSGKPAVLRVYIDEPRRDARSSFLDDLNLKLVQSIAMLQLLIGRWCEPPVLSGMHLSTLTHQVMAVIAQRGGATAKELYDLLCRQGPFRSVSTSVFADLLRAMARPEAALIEQAPDGLLLLGSIGERLADRYDFYAVFSTPDEFRVTFGEREIGRLTMEYPRSPGDLILLAGRRWRIEAVDEPSKSISVKPSPGAVPPGFPGAAGGVHDRVALEMRAVLDGDDVPGFLDPVAAQMLVAAREAYARVRGSIVQWAIDDGRLLLLPWVGRRKLQTLAAAFRTTGVDANVEDVAIKLEGSASADTVRIALALALNPPKATSIAEQLLPKATEKYHPYLTEELLNLETAAAVVDLERFDHLMEACARAIAQANEIVDISH